MGSGRKWRRLRRNYGVVLLIAALVGLVLMLVAALMYGLYKI